VKLANFAMQDLVKLLKMSESLQAGAANSGSLLNAGDALQPYDVIHDATIHHLYSVRGFFESQPTSTNHEGMKMKFMKLMYSL